jgi:hypothetical protein
MTEPAFEEFDPAEECDCAGCVHWRRAMPGGAGGAGGAGRHPAGARVVTVTAAAATAMTAAPAAVAAVAPAAVAAAVAVPAERGVAVAAEAGVTEDGSATRAGAGGAEAGGTEAATAEAAATIPGYGVAPGMVAAAAPAGADLTDAVAAPVPPAGAPRDGGDPETTAQAEAQADGLPAPASAAQNEAPETGSTRGEDESEATVAGEAPQAPASGSEGEAETATDGELVQASGIQGEGEPEVAEAGETPDASVSRDEPEVAMAGEVSQAPASRGEEKSEAATDGEVPQSTEARGEDEPGVTAVGEAPEDSIAPGMATAGHVPEGSVPRGEGGAGAPEVPVPQGVAVQQTGAMRGEGAQVGAPSGGRGDAPQASVPRTDEGGRAGAAVAERGGVTQTEAEAEAGVAQVRALRAGGVKVASPREALAVPRGAGERAGLRATSRGAIIERARRWTEADVPYDMVRTWSDGYRQDCSGFVSMAWNLPDSAWTGNLDEYAVRISQEELSPGDILLFHNPADPQDGSHVVIFGGWTDYTHTRYVAYEQTRPHAVRRVLEYPYPLHGDRYVPYRYRALNPGDGGGAGDSAGSGEEAAFPGRASFGPGAANAHITHLGRMLVERGGARFYSGGPGPRWGDADRRATQAFQRAQGWVGEEADGLPGPHTWRLLVTGRGRDIPPPGTPSSHGVTGYPGRAAFRPGAKNTYVTQLGRQLVKKGYGRHYTDGPGPVWTDADRKAVQAFQRAQGWRGGAADGYPGPETWRRLFS